MSEKPFAGLILRDDDSGKVLVAYIAPGPLEGRGFHSPHLERGDTVLAVNGQPMTAKAFDALVEASHVGDEIVFKVHRTGGPDVTSVPTPTHEGPEEEFSFKLASAAAWSGPVGFPNATELSAVADAIDHQLAPTTQPTQLEAFIDAQLTQHSLNEPIDKLCGVLADTQQKGWGQNALSRVAYGFVHPKRLLRLGKAMTDPLPAIAGDPRQCLTQAATLLDVAPPPDSDAFELAEPQKMAEWLAAHIDLASAEVNRAFAGIDPAQRAKQSEQIQALLRQIAAPDSVESSPRVNEFIAAMQASMHIDYGAMFAAGSRVSGVLSLSATAAPATQPATQPAEFGDELRSAVSGPILAARKCEAGWIVIGGPDSNTYDMSRLAGVIDVGGDDVYQYPKGARPAVQVIVDLAGNDQYAGQGIGPGSAVMGVSLINDCAGNDRYKGDFVTNGAGVMGIGILLDRAGDDRYEGFSWCDGAGVYGAGAIIDLAGGDTYVASVDSQAIGGPKGLGLILDAAGSDVYRANGPIPSVYDTPAVAYSMSQAVGLGFRRYDSGGIGIIEDLSGNDRYEGGEFSQGGGYYFGLGLLHDRAGSDVYFGNRYSQAFAAHDAIGMLIDDAGDDDYWSMTAAGQSGSWDRTVTMLLDRAGNDTYRGDGLSQGAAAMQAIAWLIDLEGNDHYVGAGTAVQGQGAGNNYSYHATGAFSWSLLLDASGGSDFYSSGRKDGQTVATGALNDKQPEMSDLSGLFIDTADPLSAP